MPLPVAVRVLFMSHAQFVSLLILTLGLLSCGGGAGGAATGGDAGAQLVVVSATPAASATGVASSSAITVTFSRDLDCKTVTASSISVGGVSGTLSCAGAQVVLQPAAPLDFGRSFQLQLADSIADTNGQLLTGLRTWSFTTTSSLFSFLAYGDSRSGNGCDGNAVHVSLVKRMVNEPASMVFNLGDMVTGYDKSTNWVQRGDCASDTSKGSLKEIIAPLQNKTPVAGLPMFYFPVMGNHDDNWGDGWYPDKFGDGFCDVFNPSLMVPNHTQKSYFQDKSSRVPHFTDTQFFSLACSKTDSSVYPTYMYYSFDFKNTHFVVMRLNNDYNNLEECASGCSDPANYDQYYNKHQLDWLKSDLALAGGRSDVQHIVVLLHAPIFSSSDGHAPNVSWPALSKLFSGNGKVHMVLQGHNHVYERSYPIYTSTSSPNGVRDDQKGTVYTTTGGGGSAVHGFRSVHPLMAVQNSDFHYLRIDVDGANVSVKAVKPDGTVMDSYSR